MAATYAAWVGRVVLERRQALGVSQQGLATRAGASVSYLALLEAGRLPKLNSEPLSHVAEALGYASLAELLYDAVRRRQEAVEVELVPGVGDQPTAEAAARWLKDVRNS